MARHTISVMLALLVTPTIAAVSHAQQLEQLPVPKPTAPAPVPPSYYIPYPPAFPAVTPAMPPPMNSREGWIYFAPNYMGRMRPRVILAPYGSYYLYNGQPYFGISSGRGYLLPWTSGGN